MSEILCLLENNLFLVFIYIKQFYFSGFELYFSHGKEEEMKNVADCSLFAFIKLTGI